MSAALEKLIVGLGNPGPRYAASRHNVGFRVVEVLARRHGIRLDEARFGGRYGAGRIASHATGLLQPLSYMNASGECVARALDDEPGLSAPVDLLVVYDDLDLELGRLRLRPAGGPGGHRGVQSVIEALASREFARLRFGIGRPPAGVDAVEYVLEDFSTAEEHELERQIARAAEAVEVWLAEGISLAMDRFNRPPLPDSA